MGKFPTEYEEVTIFKNVVLPTNYYTMDSKTNFLSTIKVSKICEDLKTILGGNTIKCGLILIHNGIDYVGFYYWYPRYVSITLGTYGNSIYLIGLSGDTPYTRIISSTTPS